MIKGFIIITLNNMKRYISLAGALLLGTVVGSTKKVSVTHKTVAVARKAAVAQV